LKLKNNKKKLQASSCKLQALKKPQLKNRISF